MRVSGSSGPRERTTTGWLGSEDTIYQHLSLELAFSERSFTCCSLGEHPPQWEEAAGEGDGTVKNVDQGGFILMPVCYLLYFYATSICIC